MSSDMLSKCMLQFGDLDLKRVYEREKIDFYNKALPVITGMTIWLAIGLEIAYRGAKLGNLPVYISAVNWVFTFLFLLIACLHHKCVSLHALVCPCLTALTFLYLSFLDYDYTLGSIYYS